MHRLKEEQAGHVIESLEADWKHLNRFAKAVYSSDSVLSKLSSFTPVLPEVPQAFAPIADACSPPIWPE
jgi:hypothetical protein